MRKIVPLPSFDMQGEGNSPKPRDFTHKLLAPSCAFNFKRTHEKFRHCFFATGFFA
jgi:hypothetical protein